MVTLRLLLSLLVVSGAFSVHADTPDENPRLDFWGTNGIVESVAIAEDLLFIGGSFSHVGWNSGVFAVFEEETFTPRLPFAGIGGDIYAVATDGNGGWFVGGQFHFVGNESHRYIAHILDDGSVSEWDPHVGGQVNAILIDGSIVYLGGRFKDVDGVERKHLAAVDSETGELLIWNPDSDDDVLTLAKLDDTVYIGGFFQQVGGSARKAIAAVTHDSGAVLDWNPGASPPAVWHIETTEGAIYVGGNFTAIAGVSRNRLAALDPATGDALDFDPGANSTVLTLATNGSSLYAGGIFTNIGGQPRNRVAEIDLATGLATEWDPDVTGGDGTSTSIERIRLQNDLVYVCGSFASVGGASRKHVAALDPLTATPTAFGTEFAGPNSTLVRDMAVTETDVAVGGQFSLVGGDDRQHLAAIDVASGTLTSWKPDPDAAVRAILVDDASLYVGGAFHQIADEDRRFLASFEVPAGNLTAFNADINTQTGYVAALKRAGEVLFAGGDFNSVAGLTRRNLVALDQTTGNLLVSWDIDAGSPVFAIAVDGQDETLFVGGNIPWMTSEEVPRNNLAAIDLSTGQLLDFAPAANDYVRALTVDDSRLFVGGDFESVGGSVRRHLAAFDADTHQLLPWSPELTGAGTDRTVHSILQTHEELFVGGVFEFVNGDYRPYVAAIDSESGDARPWNPLLIGVVLSLASDNEMLFVGGGFHQIDQAIFTSVAAFRFPEVSGTPAALTSCAITLGSTDNPPCDVANLVDNDNDDQILRSQLGFSAFERNLTEIVIQGNGPDATTMASIDTRDGSDTTNVIAKVKARNYTSNAIIDIAQYEVSFPNDDTSHSTPVNSADYVDANGDVEVRLRYVAAATFTPLGFTVGLDQVAVMVE